MNPAGRMAARLGFRENRLAGLLAGPTAQAKQGRSQEEWQKLIKARLQLNNTVYREKIRQGLKIGVEKIS